MESQDSNTAATPSSSRGAELAAVLRGAAGTEQREEVYAELLALEAEHSRRVSASAGVGSAVHVGGLAGPTELEDEGALAALFGRFGTVLAVTLRVRREVQDGKQTVSWALVSFSCADEAQAAVAGAAELAAQHTSLVVRMVDAAQLAHSTGAMREVMRKHVAARAAPIRAMDVADDIAVACASALCEVLCKDLSDVGTEELRRAAHVLTAITGIDPARVSGECNKPDQCHIWKALACPNSALGAVLAKEPSALTAEDTLTIAWATASIAVGMSGTQGLDGTMQAAGLTSLEWTAMAFPAIFLSNAATPSDDRNMVLLPLVLELLRAPEKLSDFILPGLYYAIHVGVLGRPAVATKLLEQGAIDVLMRFVREASPTELVATAGFSRHSHGWALACLKEIVEAGQAAGRDLTGALLSCGCIDALVSAIAAAEQLGVENVNGHVVVWDILKFLTVLDGEALEQIEEKLRAVLPALRYIAENQCANMVDFGVTSQVFTAILAANLYGRDEMNPFGFSRA
jgi:hypothetical protein